MLPAGYSALVERQDLRREGDVSTLQVTDRPAPEMGGIVLATKPRTTFSQIRNNDLDLYANRANRIKVLNPKRKLVSVIEIVSPGNKASREKFREFRRKCLKYLRHGVCLMIIDLFPPSRRDPQGIHNAIWKELWDESITPPEDRNRLLVSYAVNGDLEAFIEPLGVGMAMPDMPMFLARDRHIPLPLEQTYAECWRKTATMTKEDIAKGTAS